MKFRLLLVSLLPWSWPVLAQDAATPGQGRMVLQLDADAHVVRCDAARPELDENQQSLVVAVQTADGKPTQAPQAMRFVREGQDLGVVLQKGKTNIMLAAAELSGTIQVRADDASELVTCAVPAGPVAAAGAAAAAVDMSVADAREYLANKGITDHLRQRDRITLYHLPDGRPAFPIPSHLSEADKLRLVVIVPASRSAEFAVTSCEDVPGYRVAGSFNAAKNAMGMLQSRELQEIAHDVELSCSGTLSYEVRVGTPDGQSVGTRSISIKLDPIYRFSWGVALVFDFGNPNRLGLADRPAGAGSEKFISRDSSLSGVRPLFSLTFHPFRANPRNWQFCNALNLFLALDPTRLTEGFAAGFNLKPTAEIGFLIGLSVFQSEKLAEGVTETPGDAWTASGGLPTRKVFDKKSLGLLLGLEVSLDVLTSLVQ